MEPSFDKAPQKGFNANNRTLEKSMPATDETDDLHGRLLANELLTFALFALLTEKAPDRVSMINNVIIATETMIEGLPDQSAIEDRRKKLAATHWQRQKALFAQLADVDPSKL